MKDKYLPLGSVVLLKEATKRLMITGYCSMLPENQNKVYDYVGCLFPEGNLAGEEVALFDHEQIGEICHIGLEDDEFVNFNNQLKKILADEKNQNTQILSEQALFENIEINPIFDAPTISPISDMKPNIQVSNPVISNDPDGRIAVSGSVGNQLIDSNSVEKQSDSSSNNDGQPVLRLEPIYTQLDYSELTRL